MLGYFGSHREAQANRHERRANSRSSQKLKKAIGGGGADARAVIQAACPWGENSDRSDHR
jgi:hypothetical protein